MTIDDLQELDLLDGKDEKLIRITGYIGYAPAIRTMPDNFKLMHKLVPILYGDSSDWFGGLQFANFYGLNNIKLDKKNVVSQDLPIVEDNMYNTIRSDGKHILIELKK